nr:sparanegtin [Scylla paramamosain]
MAAAASGVAVSAVAALVTTTARGALTPIPSPDFFTVAALAAAVHSPSATADIMVTNLARGALTPIPSLASFPTAAAVVTSAGV